MTLTILAIDPGPVESAYAFVEAATCKPIAFDKLENTTLLQALRVGALPDGKLFDPDYVAIEMISSYGMPVGVEVFQTCVWVGRFAEAVHHGWWPRKHVRLTPRGAVKRLLCGTTTAKDSNVIQAVKDRFAPGVRNYGKGTKDEPGFFYGFKKDVWQAYALAVHTSDTAQEV